MGKKGTKRKTKWRALPLGEETGGSGNEEDLHDEDQSTTSSLVGSQPPVTNNNYKRQSVYYKSTDKSFRQIKRHPYDRFRTKEPLVKLENKTFDEEEYTKITTPRQDVLFKKGYFGRKRESSVEETTQTTGEMEGEEPMMDQIIITNGFVDERGHYLVNGNSYEIYDPYSNTVTVVVGPPPYANGVTQPVLAAVSCQPVPLTPVDWYPPASDWPSQGSAWTPSFPGTPNPDALNSPDGAPAFTPQDAQIPASYGQPAYVVQGLPYAQSPLRNGVPPQVNDDDSNPPTEAHNADDNKLQKTRRKSMDEETTETKATESCLESEKVTEPSAIAQVTEATAPNPNSRLRPPSLFTNNAASSEPRQSGIISNGSIKDQTKQTEPKPVEKQSHSTQTYLGTCDVAARSEAEIPGKESHGTQTPPEEITSNMKHSKANPQEQSNKNVNGSTKTEWRSQGRYKEFSPKKHREEYPTKVYQQRTNFSEAKSPQNADSSAMRVSYAKKAMSGLVNGNSKIPNGTVNKSPVANGQMSNGTGRPNHAKQNYEEKRKAYENVKNGYRYNNRNANGKQPHERSSQKFRERKVQLKFDEDVEKKCEELTSQSEKSSTVSELSSPTELSSGQNTPPEKVIVRKMEQEVNKSFEDKLNVRKMEEEISKSFEEKFKQSLAEKKKKEKEEEVGEEEEEEEEERKKVEEKQVGGEKEEKPKMVKDGKKKKNKPKEKDKLKEVKSSKKKKKTEEVKEKSESENSGEEIPFLAKKDLLLGCWEGLEDDDLGHLLNGDEDILKTLGLNEDRLMFSKLPLHSDLLTMPPTLGWGRPKLKIEDIFAPAHFHSDLYTKRNITNMKSTKPEEFFASVVDGPIEKGEKKKEAKKPSRTPEEGEASESAKKTKTGSKSSKKKGTEQKKPEVETKDGKLGIVEAVNTWLQEQEDSEKVLSVDTLERLTKEEEPKNGESNPMHASSASETVPEEKSACIRVANVITDGFKHVDREFGGKKPGRMYRSSSWDAKLSEMRIKKHFKFLTDSASFCQDLISDVRNGLPARNEYATEELCDPKQIVSKYYTLAPSGRTGRALRESDSENEVFDALEYKFLTRENHESESKSADGTGNVSITDSGVHSDMESSEDAATEQTKEPACKLQ